VAALTVSVLAACVSRTNVVIEQADVRARILDDGSVEVEEALIVRGTGTFERLIELDRADGVAFIDAALDGRDVETGGAAGLGVAVSAGRRRLGVRWTLGAAADPMHTIGVRYRVANAVEISGGRGTLRLPLLPADRFSVISSARLTLVVPDSMSLLTGSGISEADWSVERSADGLTAERSSIQPGEHGTFMAELAIDPSVVVEPTWQMTAARRRDLAPAFVSGALFLLVIGIGVVWIVRFQYASGQQGATGAEAQREREAARRGLRAGGVATFAVGMATAGLTWLTLGELGVWPQTIPASLLVVGAVLAVWGRRIV
jgi:hypothetical protein